MSENETTALTTLSTALEKFGSGLDTIDKIVGECSLDATTELSGLRQTFQMALGIRQLKGAITDEMVDLLMELQNSPLGFRTDRDPKNRDKHGKQVKPYDRETVKECAIIALLQGGRLMGDEFNILASRTYFTKNYFTRKLGELNGMSDLEIDPDVPRMVGEKGAVVKMSATWNYNGKRDSMEREIPIRVNAGMGADAILGKADRKMKAAIWARITGSQQTPDGDAGDGPEGTTLDVDSKPAKKKRTIDLKAVEISLSHEHSKSGCDQILTNFAIMKNDIAEDDWLTVLSLVEKRRAEIKAEEGQQLELDWETVGVLVREAESAADVEAIKTEWGKKCKKEKDWKRLDAMCDSKLRALRDAPADKRQQAEAF